MSAISLFVTSIIGALLIFSRMAYAQPTIPPCGIVTQDTTLTSNCFAPLIVGADNITIDLGGHAIYWDEDYPLSLQLVNRNGVTVKNGVLGAGMGTTAIQIEGGHSNTLENLSVGTSEFGLALLVTPGSNANTRRKSLTITRSTFFIGLESDFGGLLQDNIRFIDNTVRFGDDYPEAAYFAGSNIRVLRNVFRGIGGYVELAGSGIRFEKNLVEVSPTSTQIDDPGISVLLNASRSVVRDNTIVTSSPEVKSVGILVSRESRNDLIQRNRVTRGDTEGDIGIHVLGSRCKIFDNKTDSVVDDGSGNIVKRNVLTSLRSTSK
jgi:hypothetical protein